MGDTELKPDFKCEYAKSNMSTCRHCKEKIAKEVLRIGKLERASNFDGEIYVWHHVDCFESRHGSKIKSASDIKGLSELKWEDQDELKKKFGSSGITDNHQASSSSDDSDGGDDDDSGDENQDVFVEYATSSRSTCKSCYTNIGIKEIRIGVRTKDDAGGFESTSYYHLICYTVPSGQIISGLNTLSKEDRKNVENHLDQELKRKRELKDQAASEEHAKKRKVYESDKQKAAKIWEIKERLKEYNSNELKAILMYNNQDYKAGPTELINRIADGELNGALPMCSKCKNGHLIYDAGIIKCIGHLTAWSGCTFTCGLDEVKKRTPWKEYPKGIQLKELVEKVKGNYSKSKQVPESSTSFKSDKTLFKDMVASIVGDISDEVADMITENGGKVQATVSKQLTHLISTYEEVAKENPVTKVVNAIQWDIPIVSHAFIHTAVKKGNLRSQPRFILWEGGAAVRINETLPISKRKNVDEETLETTTKKPRKVVIPGVDPSSQSTSGTILVDKGAVYSVMLSLSDLTYGQTGKNSFYKMQIIQNSDSSSFTLFRKWGRVGQDGTTTEMEYASKKDAIDEFKKIFYEKTRNTFTDFLNNNYEKKPGKFYPIELGDEEETDKSQKEEGQAKETKRERYILDPRVAELVKLLFDTDMFKEQMEELKIDTKKMPVGKLSKTQIAKGTAVLEEIESELANPNPDEEFLLDASNRFYTIIPHDFGFEKPVIINSKVILQKRYDLLETLGDIEAAARMLDDESKAGVDPIVEQYEKLRNKITPVEHNSEEFRIIKKYWDNTKQGNGIQIEELFRLKREGESSAFSKFNSLEHRKLLWHGSSVAVFAAILNGGLKIMPHAGGRVGAGLYFADMIAKSAGYLGFHQNTGLVLLNEVALGTINRIQYDDHTLRKPPAGFDSVLAEGKIMPNPKDDYLDYSLSESGHPVVIPQGEAFETSISGSFYHNEYLIYDQAQVSMQYLIKIKCS